MGSVEIEKLDVDRPTSMGDARQAVLVEGQVVGRRISDVRPLGSTIGGCLIVVQTRAWRT